MVWRSCGLCVALAVVICCSTPALAHRQLLAAPSKNAQLAQAFCKSPDIRKLQCGWASNQEQTKTYADCLFCGTVHYGEPSNLPQTIQQTASYWAAAERVVSLACKPGRLQVKTVFKILPNNGDACTRLMPENALGTVGKSPSKVKRCELALPAKTSASAEAATAVSSKVKTVKCKEYTNCLDLADMQTEGKWYSDTYTVLFDGCNAVNKQADYMPMMPGVLVNPGSKFEIAAFTVSQA